MALDGDDSYVEYHEQYLKQRYERLARAHEKIANEKKDELTEQDWRYIKQSLLNYMREIRDETHFTGTSI